MTPTDNEILAFINHRKIKTIDKVGAKLKEAVIEILINKQKER